MLFVLHFQDVLSLNSIKEKWTTVLIRLQFENPHFVFLVARRHDAVNDRRPENSHDTGSEKHNQIQVAVNNGEDNSTINEDGSEECEDVQAVDVKMEEDKRGVKGPHVMHVAQDFIEDVLVSEGVLGESSQVEGLLAVIVKQNETEVLRSFILVHPKEKNNFLNSPALQSTKRT